jgi:hypothetical protein
LVEEIMMRNDSRSRRVILVLLLFALGFSGCNAAKNIHPVVGRVSYQSKPVAEGMVRFSNPQAGIDVLAKLQPDGAYSVRMANGNGLPEGTYAVAVVPPHVDSPVGAMTPTPQPQCPDIPQKYQGPSTSGLTLTVKPGDNSFDIDMQSGR